MERNAIYAPTPARPSIGDVVGFYAYLFAVGGGFPDRSLLADVVRRPGLIAEIIRPASEPPVQEAETTEAA